MSLDYDVVVTYNSRKGVLYKSIADTSSVFRSKWSTKFIKKFTVFRIRTIREKSLINVYII